MSAKYMWLGRKIRHAHAPVGDFLHVSAHQSEINEQYIHDGDSCTPDMVACKCGYLLCEQTGPCAPKPQDVLPEGWSRGEERLPYALRVGYLHESGACVWNDSRNEPRWYYGVKGCGKATGHQDTRAEAMAAALEAAEPWGCVNRTISGARECAESGHYFCDLWRNPAEPELRPGWRQSAPYAWRHDGCHGLVTESARGNFWVLPLGASMEEVDTLDAAMRRAEELAGLR